MKLMHNISIIGMMATAIIAISSCSLVDFDFDEVKKDRYELHLNKDTVYIMEGDTFSLSPIYTPESIDGNVFWQSNDSILTIKGNNIIASSVGDTHIKAYSSFQNLTDSCFVSVMPKWKTPIYDYPDETIVNARVMYDGKFINPAKMKVAAFINGECRGLGELKDYFGTIIIQFRVCGNIDDYNEKIQFRLYIHDKLFCEYYPQNVNFDGDIHGSIASLIVLWM